MTHRYLALAACLGCAATPLPQSGVDVPTGCYSVIVGEWSQPGIIWRLPEIIRLDSVPSHEYSDEAREWFELRPDAPTLSNARGGGGSAWQPVGVDSVRLIWAGDYEQLEARLQLRDGRMQGLVRGSTDVIRPTELLPRAPVTARSVRCPTEI